MFHSLRAVASRVADAAIQDLDRNRAAGSRRWKANAASGWSAETAAKPSASLMEISWGNGGNEASNSRLRSRNDVWVGWVSPSHAQGHVQRRQYRT